MPRYKKNTNKKPVRSKSRSKSRSRSRSKSRSPDKVELAQNVNMARFLEGLEEFDSSPIQEGVPPENIISFDDLPLDLINERLHDMNCQDRLSYCQLNRRSRDHCNSEPILSEYIKPCRKQAKLNKTKRKTIEVSRRLQYRYHNQYELDRIREDIERRERQRIEDEQQARLQEYLNIINPPIERPDIDFGDDIINPPIQIRNDYVEFDDDGLYD